MITSVLACQENKTPAIEINSEAPSLELSGLNFGSKKIEPGQEITIKLWVFNPATTANATNLNLALESPLGWGTEMYLGNTSTCVQKNELLAGQRCFYDVILRPQFSNEDRKNNLIFTYKNTKDQKFKYVLSGSIKIKSKALELSGHNFKEKKINFFDQEIPVRLRVHNPAAAGSATKLNLTLEPPLKWRHDFALDNKSTCITKDELRAGESCYYDIIIKSEFSNYNYRNYLIFTYKNAKNKNKAFKFALAGSIDILAQRASNPTPILAALGSWPNIPNLEILDINGTHSVRIKKGTIFGKALLKSAVCTEPQTNDPLWYTDPAVVKINYTSNTYCYFKLKRDAIFIVLNDLKNQGLLYSKMRGAYEKIAFQVAVGYPKIKVDEVLDLLHNNFPTLIFSWEPVPNFLKQKFSTRMSHVVIDRIFSAAICDAAHSLGISGYIAGNWKNSPLNPLSQEIMICGSKKLLKLDY